MKRLRNILLQMIICMVMTFTIPNMIQAQELTAEEQAWIDEYVGRVEVYVSDYNERNGFYKGYTYQIMFCAYFKESVNNMAGMPMGGVYNSHIIKWESSDENIIKVYEHENGSDPMTKFDTVNAGTAIITVKIGNFSDSLAITVRDTIKEVNDDMIPVEQEKVYKKVTVSTETLEKAKKAYNDMIWKEYTHFTSLFTYTDITGDGIPEVMFKGGGSTVHSYQDGKVIKLWDYDTDYGSPYAYFPDSNIVENIGDMDEDDKYSSRYYRVDGINMTLLCQKTYDEISRKTNYYIEGKTCTSSEFNKYIQNFGEKTLITYYSYLHLSEVLGITLDTTNLVLGISDTYNMELLLDSRKASWSSSNPSVAKVSSDGKITAKKTGVATITAKIGNEKAICKVTVLSAKKTNDKAKKAYKTFLKDKNNYESKEHIPPKELGDAKVKYSFALLDIDKDGVSELIIQMNSINDYHVWMIFQYSNNQISDVKELLGWELRYNTTKKTLIVFDDSEYENDYWLYQFNRPKMKFIKGFCKLKEEKKYVETYKEFPAPSEFKNLSKAKYNDLYKKYIQKSKKVKFYSNTSANRKKYLK